MTQFVLSIFVKTFQTLAAIACMPKSSHLSIMVKLVLSQADRIRKVFTVLDNLYPAVVLQFNLSERSTGSVRGFAIRENYSLLGEAF